MDTFDECGFDKRGTTLSVDTVD